MEDIKKDIGLTDKELQEQAKERQREYHRKWREENREEYNEYQKKWRRENKEKVKEYNQNYWKKKVIEEKGQQ